MANKKMVQVSKRVWKELNRQKIDREKASINEVLKEILNVG